MKVSLLHIHEVRIASIYQGAYTVPETKSNLRLGSKVNFGLINGQYYAFVSAQGNNETSNFGSVHVFKNNNGVWVLAKDENYKGSFDDNVSYYTNDIVYSAGYSIGTIKCGCKQFIRSHKHGHSWIQR